MCSKVTTTRSMDNSMTKYFCQIFATTALAMFDQAAATANSTEIGDKGYLNNDFVEGSNLWSLLVVGYSVVFVVGVAGNIILLAALRGPVSRTRALPVRNHLMMNLAVADLLVTGICVPISACAAANHACWPSTIVSWMCQLGPLLQRTPVAASTLSLALLSLDRWAAVRHPRLAQKFRDRRVVAVSMLSSWLLASAVAAPTLWFRQWQDDGETRNTSTNQTDHTQESVNGVCVEQWTNLAIQLTYTVTYLGTVFISPALIVAVCHASVSHKLKKQLRVLSETVAGNDKSVLKGSKTKPVIIVARDPSSNIISNPNIQSRRAGILSNISNNPAGNSVTTAPRPKQRPASKLVMYDPNDDDDDDLYIKMQIEADLESFQQLSQLQPSQNNLSRNSYFGSGNNDNSALHGIRAARKERVIIRANRKLRKKVVSSASSAVHLGRTSIAAPPPLMPTYSSQSFRSRRRAANLLAALAGVFVFCWAPYVCCAICEMFISNKLLVRQLIPFALLLGHAHSAINPVVSWRLNRSAFVRFQNPNFLSSLCKCSIFRGCKSCTANCCKCSLYLCQCSCSCCRESVPSNIIEQPRNRYQQRRPTAAVNNRFLAVPNHLSVHGQRRLPQQQYNHNLCEASSSAEQDCSCFQRRGESREKRQEDQEGIPCCCCFCPANGPFARRTSSADPWNWKDSSTNEAHLGAFHPKYLSRLPVVQADQISQCHTSHFLH